jgi:hypothetical protein
MYSYISFKETCTGTFSEMLTLMILKINITLLTVLVVYVSFFWKVVGLQFCVWVLSP